MTRKPKATITNYNLCTIAPGSLAISKNIPGSPVEVLQKIAITLLHKLHVEVLYLPFNMWPHQVNELAGCQNALTRAAANVLMKKRITR